MVSSRENILAPVVSKCILNNYIKNYVITPSIFRDELSGDELIMFCIDFYITRLCDTTIVYEVLFILSASEGTD